MTRRALFSAAFPAAAALFAAPRVSRADLRNLEAGFDRRINQAVPEDPFDLLGNTRGVYLEKYGVVFSAEVGLVIAPAPTPFAPVQSKEAKDKLRTRKLARLPLLRRMMRDMMVNSATALRAMPLEEQVVVGVSLFYQPWEDTTGLPGQIVLQTTRKRLVDFEQGRLDANALNDAILEQVF